MKRRNSKTSGFDSQNKIKGQNDTKIKNQANKPKRTKGNGGCK